MALNDPPAAPSAPPPPYISDPGYVNAQNVYNRKIGRLDSRLRKYRSQSLVDFGNPSLIGSRLGFGVDQNTAAAAKANPYSVYALLQKSLADQGRGISNSLGGRGLVSSGDFGYLNNQANQAYGQNLASAEQKLLSYLNDLQQGYLDDRGSADSDLEAARQAAYQWSIDHPSAPTARDAIYGLGQGGLNPNVAAALAKMLSGSTLLRTVDDQQWRAAGSGGGGDGAPAPVYGAAPSVLARSLLR